MIDLDMYVVPAYSCLLPYFARFAELTNLRGATVDLAPGFLVGLVSNNSIITLFCLKTACVSDECVFPVNELMRLAYVGGVCISNLIIMSNTTVQIRLKYLNSYSYGVPTNHSWHKVAQQSMKETQRPAT